MWISLAICSAIFLGIYDVLKKFSVRGNAVLLVMLVSSGTSLLMMLPLILISHFSPETLQGSVFYVPFSGGCTQFFIFIKSIIVLTSWVFSFFAMKYLPISIVAPIRSSAPMWTLVGAVLVLNESLATFQWIGILLIIGSLLSYSFIGKREGIDFKHNIWILFIFFGTIIGSVSALFDKFLIAEMRIPKMEIQAWFSVYQFLLMIPTVMILWFPKRHKTDQFQWRWTIPLVGVFLVIADFFYYFAVSVDGALIAVISAIRRSNVIISFLAGAFIFREKNILRKGIALIGVLVGIFILYMWK